MPAAGGFFNTKVKRMTNDPDDATLNDPAFLNFVERKFGGREIQPEAQDFDFDAPIETAADRARAMEQAQRLRLLRLHREWKAGSQ